MMSECVGKGHPNSHCNDVCVCVLSPRYTKLGFAGNTEPQFIMPSGKQKGRGVGDVFDPNLTNFIPITSH